MITDDFEIYWANSMFSEADREFNLKYVNLLRDQGFRVFLPQEAGINLQTTPSSSEIFRRDSVAILNSKLIIACIDQEAIDSGVACEIGLAIANDIPIIGFYTDIRQHRRGQGKMYKNMYVIGGILQHGEVVATYIELLNKIKNYLAQTADKKKYNLEKIVGGNFNIAASNYSDFIRKLETWYSPYWNVNIELERWIEQIKPKRIIDFGCGTGEVSRFISTRYPNISYVGYDRSKYMIESARLEGKVQYNHSFTSSWKEVVRNAQNEPFDLGLAFFCLHDTVNQVETLSLLSSCLRKEGVILLQDLSKSDLPEILKLLRKVFISPSNSVDNRIDFLKLIEFESDVALRRLRSEFASPIITFPSSEGIKEYFEIFGIFDGLDLPLNLHPKNRHTNRELINGFLEHMQYPFIDQRVFITCAYTKK